jgi:hypothetical protein
MANNLTPDGRVSALTRLRSVATHAKLVGVRELPDGNTVFTQNFESTIEAITFTNPSGVGSMNTSANPIDYNIPFFGTTGETVRINAVYLTNGGTPNDDEEVYFQAFFSSPFVYESTGVFTLENFIMTAT